MQVYLRLILDSTKPAAARKQASAVADRIGGHIDTLQPYDKGGMDASMRFSCGDAPWPDQVTEVLQKAQAFGRGWHITGAIEDEISLTTTEFSIPGIRFASIMAERGDQGLHDG